MSRADLDFAGPGALSFLARGYRYDAPAGIDLDAPATLHHPNAGVVLIAVLDRARRGDRTALPTLLDLLIDEHPVVSAVSHELIGQAGGPALLVELGQRTHDRVFEQQPPDWWAGLYTAKALLASRLGWVVPPTLQIYTHVAASPSVRRELGIIPFRLQRMLWPRDAADASVLTIAHARGDIVTLIREALARWRPLVEALGMDTPLLHAAPFDLDAIVEPLRAWANEPTGPTTVVHLREALEVATGLDCSSWFDTDGRPRRLQIAAAADRFATSLSQRFPPGQRWFAGWPLDDPPDPSAHAWCARALAELDQKLAERDGLEVHAALVSDLDSDLDEPGPDEYLYSALFDAPSDRSGDPYARLAAAAQDAYLGEFDDLAPQLEEALVQVFDDEHYDYTCARLLGDAAPLDELDTMVERLRPRLFEASEARDPRWQELMIIALASAGTPRCLRRAAELIAIFDASQARFGRPWYHLQSSLPPRAGPAAKAWLRQDDQALRVWLDEALAELPDDARLWRGQPLELATLTEELFATLFENEPDLDATAELRHQLESMTGVELRELWINAETLDPEAGELLVAKLRRHPVVLDHRPGERWFYANLVSPLRSDEV